MSASAVVTRLKTRIANGRVDIGGGVQLAYIERGSGPALVFIPAWTFTKEVFHHQMAYFEKNFRVIAYDPRSQGESTSAIEGNDYVTHAQDLAALLKALEVENPIIVGWSAGALAAWGYTRLKGPQSIAAMIVIDQPPKGMSLDSSDWTEGSLEEQAATHTLFLRDRAGQAQYTRRYIEDRLVQRMVTDEERDWLLHSSLSTNPLVAAQLFASCMFSDLTMPAVAVSRARPTLFFIAQHWAEKAVRHIRGKMPEAKTAVFGGHMMFWEYPDAFNQVLDEFLTGFVLGKTIKKF
jgi:pimeloyl-ACP methyl ester carboxylesterase